jgi:mediator of RNA polymerase II transcription subunit 14
LQHVADLDIESILSLATRAHAALLTRQQTAAALTASRSLISGQAPPTLVENTDASSTRPLALHIPLPSKQRTANLIVSVSSLTGLLEVEDDGAKYLVEQNGTDDRAQRARMTTSSVNEGRTRLLDDVGRLMAAVS